MEQPEIKEDLVNILLKIPAFQNRSNRDSLLFRLEHLGNSISRSEVSVADIISIVSSLAAVGQLTSGIWPLTILINNALRYCPQNTTPGRQLEDLLNKFEPSLDKQKIPPLAEIVVGADERLPIMFFEKALKAQKSVARLLVPRIFDGEPIGSPPESVVGTGWMIGPNMLLTNYHVIAARYSGEESPSKYDLQIQAEKAITWFGYNNWDSAHTDYCCTHIIQTNQNLDYALLHLDMMPIYGDVPLSDWGILSTNRTQFPYEKGKRLNIIQHPRGEEKRLAIRSNYYIGSSSLPNRPARIQYLTDTEPGASGSPVCDDDWNVVALHHAAIRVPESQYKGDAVKYNNEGIEISAVLNDIENSIRAQILGSTNALL